MNKFIHEKSRRKDLVKERGADPIWSSIRKNDEYVEGAGTREFIFKHRPELEEQPSSRNADRPRTLPKTNSQASLVQLSGLRPKNPSASIGRSRTGATGTTGKAMSKREFAATAEGAGLRNRALKRAYWEYRNRISGVAAAESELGDGATKKEKERAGPEAFDTKVIGSLSYEAREIYTKLIFAHPDTRLGEIRYTSKDSGEIDVISFNKSFIFELQRALVSYDKVRQAGNRSDGARP